MSPTEAVPQHLQTGLSDSSHSSSSSAEKYTLDEFDTSPILLYKYRGGLQTSSQKELCAWLDKGPFSVYCDDYYCASADMDVDESLRVTKKAIPRYTSYLDVQRADLYLPQEREDYANYPNFNSNLASIRMPSVAYWSRLLFGNYSELFIVSPETSPSGSPTNTLSREESREAHSGAVDEIRAS